MKYVLQRIGAMLITLFFVMSLSFMVIRLMPMSLFENPEVPKEIQEKLEDKFHLNDPLPVQYFYFMEGIITGLDFGISVKLRPGLDVWGIIVSRLPPTMLINFISLFISIPLGLMFGIIAALKRNTWIDTVISVFVILFISVPSFVFASLLQYFVAGKLAWLPLIYDSTGTPKAQFVSLVLPVLALAFSPIATVTRYLRGELIETLSSEYMLLARTKGLKKAQAVMRHAFRNSMVPLANIIIPMFTNIMGGSMVVESIFAVPGIGGILVDSITVSDYSLAIGALLFYSFISVATILIVDISYGIIDPRIRLGAKKS